MITLEQQRDLQATQPDLRIALDAAGVSGVERVVQWADQPATIARIDVTVGLAAEQRGVHMSRFHEAIATAIDAGIATEKSDITGLALAIAAEASERHGGASAHVKMVCRIAHVSLTPSTGRPSEEHVDLIGEANIPPVTADDQQRRTRTLGVVVTGMNACPCAQELVRGAAEIELRSAGFSEHQLDTIFATVPVASHNQRATAYLSVTTDQIINPHMLIAICQASMSAPINELLKRPDELSVVVTAHRNAKFVEDSVREMLAHTARLDVPFGKKDRVSARQINFESIHAHDAWAQASMAICDLRQLLI